jgi:hypothetical protein
MLFGRFLVLFFFPPPAAAVAIPIKSPITDNPSPARGTSAVGTGVTTGGGLFGNLLDNFEKNPG